MMDAEFIFVIGGREFRAPVMTFLALHAAWPHYVAMLAAERSAADARQRVVEKTASAEDEEVVLGSMILRTASAIEIAAAAMILKPDPADRPKAHELKALLLGHEMVGLNNEVLRLMSASLNGGRPQSGEAEAVTSMAIFDPLSPNSPPAASVAEIPATLSAA